MDLFLNLGSKKSGTMQDALVYNKFSSLPEQLKTEAADFIDFLLEKAKRVNEQDQRKPVFGSGKGMFKMSEDFDAPLEDFKDYM